jgi:hypothetical protein
MYVIVASGTHVILVNVIEGQVGIVSQAGGQAGR